VKINQSANVTDKAVQAVIEPAGIFWFVFVAIDKNERNFDLK